MRDAEMTVMMHDCRANFDEFPEALHEFLYADDTLLMGSDPILLQRYMQMVATEGGKYGLLLNNGKLEMMQNGYGLFRWIGLLLL